MKTPPKFWECLANCSRSDIKQEHVDFSPPCLASCLFYDRHSLQVGDDEVYAPYNVTIRAKNDMGESPESRARIIRTFELGKCLRELYFHSSMTSSSMTSSYPFLLRLGIVMLVANLLVNVFQHPAPPPLA